MFDNEPYPVRPYVTTGAPTQLDLPVYRETAVAEAHTPESYVTKDSGVREAYDSGMVRDTQQGKARFDLLRPKGVPYAAQFLTRVADLMTRGAEKYGFRNWEVANSQAELERFENSAERHLQQYLAGETDEDHAAAVVFNLLAAETTRWKMQNNG